MAAVTPIRVIIGLGNPGAEYLRTRHNVGFWFLDALAAEQRTSFRSTRRFFAETAKVRMAGEDILLVKPETFVNRSGQSARAVLDFFKHAPEQVLVVHDDLDLPAGTVRVKRGGGHGGHNGLRDIIRHIGDGFARLRFGIGHPGDRPEVIDYVLGTPRREEEDAILDGFAAAFSELPHIIGGDFDAAARALHTRK